METKLKAGKRLLNNEDLLGPGIILGREGEIISALRAALATARADAITECASRVEDQGMDADFLRALTLNETRRTPVPMQSAP